MLACRQTAHASLPVTPSQCCQPNRQGCPGITPSAAARPFHAAFRHCLHQVTGGREEGPAAAECPPFQQSLEPDVTGLQPPHAQEETVAWGTHHQIHSPSSAPSSLVKVGRVAPRSGIGESGRLFIPPPQRSSPGMECRRHRLPSLACLAARQPLITTEASLPATPTAVTVRGCHATTAFHTLEVSASAVSAHQPNMGREAGLLCPSR